MADLVQSREKIDAIDRQIAELFMQRMEIAADVAEYKRATGKKVFDREREQSKLAALCGMAAGDFNQKGIRELFTQLMSISRKRQYALLSAEYGEPFRRMAGTETDGESKVVYFGVKGSYSEQAMLEYFGEGTEGIPAATFKEVMEKIKNGEARYGVLPIENTTTGGIADIYDLLLQYDNYIIAEHILKIEHALLALPGAALSDIREVYSHPQALAQCGGFFKENPGISAKAWESTAAAADFVAKAADKAKAALAGEQVAGLYGLSVLKERVNSEAVNSTRFIVITKERAYFEDANKVSICFELPHESGTLYNMLSHMIYNDLNMTKIESRPIAGRRFEYRFFVDFEGNLQDAGVKNALNGIKEEATALRVLGNFRTK